MFLRFAHILFLLLIQLILAQLIMPFSLAKAEIYNADNVAEINNIIMKSLKDRDVKKSLVILSLDNFILTRTNPAFYFDDQRSRSVVEKQIQRMKLSKLPYLDELILVNYDHQLSENSIVNFVEELQKTQVPMMAVTRNISGSLNNISHLEVWTYLYLKNLGIDLALSPIGKYQIRFDKRFKPIRGTYPTFYRGLLSCNSYKRDNSPQSVIATLLAVKLNWLPDVVYVVDSDKGYLKSLQEQFKSLRPDIQFMGFVYENKNHQPKSNLTKTEFDKFWSELVVKLNEVKRVELKSVEDPYEQ